MASVDFDPEDYLDEVRTKDLREELERREGRTKDNVEPWTAEGMADDLQLAFYSRNARHFEALLCVLRRHENSSPVPSRTHSTYKHAS